ncbi:MAG: ribosome biogenesis GTPase Der [Ignavibacteriales bacterium]|nr:ribosome biogenesis GTPase Der [Ignavibacteriales bacterium]
MPTQVIAIVGRPNVGKSTLFNRIIGAQHAIVHDQPGVTRDRHYGTGEWIGKPFTLIDTGGFVPESEDVFEKAIREQAHIAITEADLVMFVVDAHEGLMSIDKEIAAILRTSKKKVLLIVNKVDTALQEFEAAQFHALGLGDPIAISAMGGRNIGDFLDSLTKDLVVEEEGEDKDERLRLAVIGKPNVGKSSLVNALTGIERSIVTPIAGTTRDPIDSLLKRGDEEIVLIDTAGLVKKKRIKESVDFFSTVRTLRSIERCNVALVLFDANEGIEKQDLKIVESAIERNRGVVIGINKWDLVEKETMTSVEYEKDLRKRLRIHNYVPVVFISAKTKQRIFKLIDMACHVNAERHKRIPTTALNEKMLADIQHYPPSTKTGKDVKIKYITQVVSNPPIFVFFANEPQMVTVTYKRYLENRLRKHFDFTGVPLTLQFKRKGKR